MMVPQGYYKKVNHHFKKSSKWWLKKSIKTLILDYY